MDSFKGWPVTRHLPGDSHWRFDRSLLTLGSGAVGWYGRQLGEEPGLRQLGWEPFKDEQDG